MTNGVMGVATGNRDVVGDIAARVRTATGRLVGRLVLEQNLGYAG
jgi:hypothetical protein